VWTEDELTYLKINYGVIPVKEIAKNLGKTLYATQKQIQRHKFKKQPTQREYAIYFDDHYMFSGSVKECAEFLGVSQSTVYFYSTPAHKKRFDKYKGARRDRLIIAVDLGRWPVNEEEYYEALEQIAKRI